MTGSGCEYCSFKGWVSLTPHPPYIRVPCPKCGFKQDEQVEQPAPSPSERWLESEKYPDAVILVQTTDTFKEEYRLSEILTAYARQHTQELERENANLCQVVKELANKLGPATCALNYFSGNSSMVGKVKAKECAELTEGNYDLIRRAQEVIKP